MTKQLGEQYELKRKLSNDSAGDLKKILEAMKNYKPSKEEVEEPPNTTTTQGSGLEGMLGFKDITPSDYIMFLKQDGSQFAVTINLEYGGNDWYNQNKLAIKSKRLVSDINEAMIMYREVVDSHMNNRMLYHPDGNEVKNKVREDLYNQLTQNNWQNLNAIFFEKDKDKGIFLMKKAIGLDDKGELIYDSGINVSSPVENGKLVSLNDFDSNGFPKKVSDLDEFNRDNDIKVYNPANQKVVRLSSGSVISYLYCGSYPGSGDASLGVRLSIARGQ